MVSEVYIAYWILGTLITEILVLTWPNQINEINIWQQVLASRIWCFGLQHTVMNHKLAWQGSKWIAVTDAVAASLVITRHRWIHLLTLRLHHPQKCHCPDSFYQTCLVLTEQPRHTLSHQLQHQMHLPHTLPLWKLNSNPVSHLGTGDRSHGALSTATASWTLATHSHISAKHSNSQLCRCFCAKQPTCCHNQHWTGSLATFTSMWRNNLCPVIKDLSRDNEHADTACTRESTSWLASLPCIYRPGSSPVSDSFCFWRACHRRLSCTWGMTKPPADCCSTSTSKVTQNTVQVTFIRHQGQF